MTTYHLWLKPSGKAYDILVHTITALSREYHGPFFGPHITLLGNLPGTEEEISLRSSQLGTSLQPFDIQLTAPAYQDQYFQCLFLKAQETPALINAHEVACSRLLKAHHPYMPHLSLLYGHYPKELKKKIIAALPQNLLLSFTVDTFDLIQAKSENPKDWCTLLSFPFGQ